MEAFVFLLFRLTGLRAGKHHDIRHETAPDLFLAPSYGEVQHTTPSRQGKQEAPAEGAVMEAFVFAFNIHIQTLIFGRL